MKFEIIENSNNRTEKAHIEVDGNYFMGFYSKGQAEYFLKVFKEKIIRYFHWEEKEENQNLGFIFYECGYSGPAQNRFIARYGIVQWNLKGS